MGYKFQFVTLAGFHSLNHAMFELSAGYAKRGMAAYSELQQLEFASESKGYTCSKHQREVHLALLLAQCTCNSCICLVLYIMHHGHFRAPCHMWSCCVLDFLEAYILYPPSFELNYADTTLEEYRLLCSWWLLQ